MKLREQRVWASLFFTDPPFRPMVLVDTIRAVFGEEVAVQSVNAVLRRFVEEGYLERYEDYVCDNRGKRRRAYFYRPVGVCRELLEEWWRL